MPVVQVQNNTKGPLVMAATPTSPGVEWQGEGDPMGGDVQMCDETLVESPAFYKAVQRGLLTIVNPEDNPDLVDKIQRQNDAYAARIASADAAAKASIDQAPKNDVLAVPCVGPSGTGRCGVDVLVREADKNAKPPLCGLHADLAPQYVPTHVEENGRAVVIWARATMGERQRQEV